MRRVRKRSPGQPAPHSPRESGLAGRPDDRLLGRVVVDDPRLFEGPLAAQHRQGLVAVDLPDPEVTYAWA